MKRLQKIERLAAVNFSIEELSRMSNNTLDATYEAARHLMEEHNERLDRVRRQEGMRASAMKRQLAERQRDKRLEMQWLAKYRPIAPIVAHKPAERPEDTIRTLLRKCEERERQYAQLFRETGDAEYAKAAREANTAKLSLMQELKLEVSL